MFIPSWKIWTEVTDLVGRFETDDAFQRTTVILILICLVGYTSNIDAAFWTTYRQLIAFYIAAEIVLFATYVRMAILLNHVRPVMCMNATYFLISIALWVGSCFVTSSLGARLAIIWVALNFGELSLACTGA